jgi:hypothetical protein
VFDLNLMAQADQAPPAHVLAVIDIYVSMAVLDEECAGYTD